MTNDRIGCTDRSQDRSDYRVWIDQEPKWLHTVWITARLVIPGLHCFQVSLIFRLPPFAIQTLSACQSS